MSNNPITWDDIDMFITKPHLFGHFLGYPDLIELHGEWIKDAWIRKDKKAMQAHRNSFKTTAILIVGAIWYHLFYDPNATVMILRKAESDAQKVINTIMGHMETREVKYIAAFLYKTVNLKTDQWSKSSVKTSLKKKPSPEGNFDAKGITSNIVGSHYDFIMPDDIINIKDRISKTEREATKTMLRELKNIVKQPDGQIFYSGTPWHKDDGWTICPKPDIYPVGTIDIPGFRKDELDETMKAMRVGNTESMVAANYYLKHITDEGRVFGEPQRAPWPEFDKIKKMIAYVDPAYEGDNTTAMAVGAQDINKQTYVRLYMWPDAIDRLYTRITKILKDLKCGTMYIEENADKGLSTKEFKKIYPSVQGRYEKENKHARIITHVRKNWDKIIFADDCNDNAMAQLLDYEEGQEPDDMPDALAGLCRELRLGGTNIMDRY